MSGPKLLSGSEALPPASAGAPRSDHAPRSVEDQLRSLKSLYEQGLISNEVYLDKQRKILDTMK